MHRRRLAGRARAAGLGRLPPVGRLFLGLSMAVAVTELWPIADAALSGVTDLLQLASNRLPAAARSAAMVALPAAVLWARARTPRTNPWLWTGALIIAVVELLRVPADLVERAMFAGADGDGSLAVAVASIVGLALAVAASLGVWALAGGLRDAGARLPGVVTGAVAVAVVVLVGALFGPSLVASLAPGSPAGASGLDVVVGVVSVAVNALYLFVLALLAATAIRGASAALEPPRAWWTGALSTVAIVALPVASVVLALAAQGSSGIEFAGLFTALRVGVFLGWPLLALSLAAGMGAWPARSSGARPRRHRLLASPAFRAAPGGPTTAADGRPT